MVLEIFTTIGFALFSGFGSVTDSNAMKIHLFESLLRLSSEFLPVNDLHPIVPAEP